MAQELFETNASKLARANDDIAGFLADAEIGLYKEEVPNTTATTKTDVTDVEANFDGYAVANIDWQAPSIADDGEVEVVGICPEFRPTGNNVDNAIYGCYIQGNGDGAMYFFGPLDGGPVQMAETTDALYLTVRYRPQGPSLTVTVS